MTRAAYWVKLDDRLAESVEKALKRKPTAEARLAAAIRAASDRTGRSPKLTRALVDTAEVLIAREAFSRPLYGAAIRTLAEDGHPKAAALLTKAMQGAEGGGLHTMAAATKCSAPKLCEPLARVAASPKAHMAFAATLVMRMRGEARAGQLLSSVARIKESARIDLCTELLSPMLHSGALPSLPPSTAAPMKVLRDAERHLGRWLVFARGALAAGDRSAVEEAATRAREGSQSSRTAWELLAWAIDETEPPPETRPSAEVIARLSDRPTSEKDMSFLFRLASVRSAGARSMLEGLCRGALDGPSSMRAAAALASHYGDRRGVDRLRKIADGDGPRDRVGLAVASLWDAGERREAIERAAELHGARNLPCAIWGGLVVAMEREPEGDARRQSRVIDEASFRRLEAAMVQ